MKDISYLDIKNLIEKYDEIVLYRHIKPDFDAAGSVYALKEIIKLNYPNKKVYLNGFNRVYSNYFYPQNKASLKIVKKSLAIICDTSTENRCDDDSYKLAKEHLVIDHHIANNFPYDNLFVHPEASSTSILIAKFALVNNLKINCDAASYLYGGIISDTQKLSIDKVNNETFSIVSYLAKQNIDIPAINRAVYDESIDDFKAKVFFMNKIVFDGELAYFYAKKNDLKKNNIYPTKVKDFIDTMNSIEGIEKWAVFSQNEDGTYTGSLRSHKAVIVQIAQQYNGGGHNLACGVNNIKFKDTKEILIKLKEAK